MYYKAVIILTYPTEMTFCQLNFLSSLGNDTLNVETQDSWYTRILSQTIPM